MERAPRGGHTRGPLHRRGVPNFFRKPYGPGWALVGDAGYTKDPVTAQGIANAFLSAEQVASTLTAVWAGERSFEEAMRRYQVERDRAVLPMYEFTTQLATLEPPPPDMQELLVAVAGNQPAMDAFVSVNAGTMSPEEFFDPDHLAGLFAPAGDGGNVPAAGKEVAAR